MDDPPKAKTPLRSLIIAMFVFVTICFVDGISHGPELVFPLPEPWRSLVLGVGFLAGVPLALALATQPIEMSKFQKLSCVIVLPILCMTIASYCSRRAVEAYGFMNVTPVEAQVFVPIVRMNNRRIDSATVLPSPTAREVRVFVTPELLLRLDPYRHPGRDCLILVEQSGRNGIKRLMVPGFFDDEIGTISFRRCSAA